MQLQVLDSRRDFSIKTEIQRLKELIPKELQSHVSIEQCLPKNSRIISTSFVKSHQFLISIDVLGWQQFSLSQRNLLFWHEIAKIQTQNFQPSLQPYVIGMSTIALLAELASHNLVGIATTLAVMSLGFFQLYQQHWGEQSLKRTSASDQDAIRLAVNFGYSSAQAQHSLYGALKRLAEQKASKAHRKEFQFRAVVLEIVATESGI